MAVVGEIARPHGIRGQVVVNLRTDFPHERFQPGGELFVQIAGGTAPMVSMIIDTVRFQQGRPVIKFAGVDDRGAASALAGRELRVPLETLAALPAGTFYWHDLIGSRVETVSGELVGEVSAVEGGAGGSRLVIPTPRGEVQVPLAAEICRSIDVAEKRIVIAPPAGLLDLNIRERG